MERKPEEQLTAERLQEVGLKEVWLLELNGKPINENTNAAWEIIKGAYCEVLRNDPEWHFFYEDTYNIIRCLPEFYDGLLDYLDECGVLYSQIGRWVDGQSTTLRHQHIFQPMFHTFSMMALEEYKWWTITNILDRVVHCFLNHQYLVLDNYIKTRAYPALWESNLILENAMYRAHYTGRCEGIKGTKQYYEDKKKDVGITISTNNRWICKLVDFFKRKPA